MVMPVVLCVLARLVPQCNISSIFNSMVLEPCANPGCYLSNLGANVLYTVILRFVEVAGGCSFVSGSDTMLESMLNALC